MGAEAIAPPDGVEILTWAERPDLVTGLYEVYRQGVPDIPGEEGRKTLETLVAAYRSGETHAPVTLPLTQEEIAGLAGTSRATVNRVLRQEEGRGTVSLGRGRTVLLDVAALARRRR